MARSSATPRLTWLAWRGYGEEGGRPGGPLGNDPTEGTGRGDRTGHDAGGGGVGARRVAAGGIARDLRYRLRPAAGRTPLRSVRGWGKRGGDWSRRRGERCGR